MIQRLLFSICITFLILSICGSTVQADTLVVCPREKAVVQFGSTNTDIVIKTSSSQRLRCDTCHQFGFYPLESQWVWMLNAQTESKIDSVFIELVSRLNFGKSEYSTCFGNSLTIVLPQGYNYQVYYRNQLLGTGESGVVIPSVKKGQYKVSTSDEFGCEHMFSPKIRVAGREGKTKHLNACSGDSLKLIVNGLEQVTWSGAENILSFEDYAIYKVDSSKTITASMSNNGCSWVDSFKIEVPKFSAVSLPDTIEVQFLDTLSYKPESIHSLEWFDDEYDHLSNDSLFLIANESQMIILIASEENCGIVDSVYLKVIYNIELPIEILEINDSTIQASCIQIDSAQYEWVIHNRFESFNPIPSDQSNILFEFPYNAEYRIECTILHDGKYRSLSRKYKHSN